MFKFLNSIKLYALLSKAINDGWDNGRWNTDNTDWLTVWLADTYKEIGSNKSKLGKWRLFIGVGPILLLITKIYVARVQRYKFFKKKSILCADDSICYLFIFFFCFYIRLNNAQFNYHFVHSRCFVDGDLLFHSIAFFHSHLSILSTYVSSHSCSTCKCMCV